MYIATSKQQQRGSLREGNHPLQLAFNLKRWVPTYICSRVPRPTPQRRGEWFGSTLHFLGAQRHFLHTFGSGICDLQSDFELVLFPDARLRGTSERLGTRLSFSFNLVPRQIFRRGRKLGGNQSKLSRYSTIWYKTKLIS